MTTQPVDAAVAGFFSGRPELARAVRDAPLAVAFSGGPDSTALLRAMQVGAPRFGWRPVAVHVDHRLDDGSAWRARAAGRIAARLGVPCQVNVARSLAAGWSLEEWARAERYRLLVAAARSLGAAAVLTAHHRLDQAETVLLRILFGSGTAGLGAMRPVSDRLGPPLLRPLLDLDPASLRDYAALSGVEPVDDPTNRASGPRRNFVRRRLLPVLAAEAPDVGDRLVRLARAARRAEPTVRRLLDEALVPRSGDHSCEVEVEALMRLPGSLWPAALARLHRLAGATYPPTRNARRELARQLRRRSPGGRSVGCDCGGGWRWEQSRDRLRVLRPGPRENQGTGSLEVRGLE
ncbi:MAG: tRNA lysidine(34) synthetase TilS [Acidobacteria bacterium]|nr:tRNA lysidine(34) synthetase TilS [Acidobacteriota bacterium]MXZ39034.1 tRNA lysidine(34) synthetase TilS [Holophagales bacterium]MYF05461.1 tRNA lysidine(34) synthetase TilS [Holophagales bacterium]MYJ25854.1 tRNA lysidine(34) synthetase TilS [Holophagales bacterium]